MGRYYHFAFPIENRLFFKYSRMKATSVLMVHLRIYVLGLISANSILPLHRQSGRGRKQWLLDPCLWSDPLCQLYEPKEMNESSRYCTVGSHKWHLFNPNGTASLHPASAHRVTGIRDCSCSHNMDGVTLVWRVKARNEMEREGYRWVVHAWLWIPETWSVQGSLLESVWIN
jgi:hypothetical protein